MIELSKNQIEMVSGAAWSTPIGNALLRYVDWRNDLSSRLSPTIKTGNLGQLFNDAHKVYDYYVEFTLDALTNIGNIMGATYQLQNPSHFKSEWGTA